jgi:hypothetical protein
MCGRELGKEGEIDTEGGGGETEGGVCVCVCVCVCVYDFVWASIHALISFFIIIVVVLGGTM